jgi:ABC-type dipeptide/oligopeptide/nickel transport system permease component
MKIFTILLTAIVAISILAFWYQVYVQGQYYANAGLFFTILFGAVPIFVLAACLIIFKTIKKN